jgi:uncharacterized protein YbcI
MPDGQCEGVVLEQTMGDRTSKLMEVSTALVRLHKQHFGRGPTRARSDFVGDDVLVCVLRGVLTAAERTMLEAGKRERVREFRTSFHDSTPDQVIALVEPIIGRKILAFTYAIDPDTDVLFKNFLLEPADRGAFSSAPVRAPET